jgi:pilus assembly protein CpaB
MPIRTIATVAVAALLGLVAVFLVQSYLSRQRAADQSQAVIAGTAPVVVAAQPIARGVALQPALLKVVRYPAGSVPPGALTDVSQASQGGQRLVLRAFAPNEPILADRITTPGGKVNMSAAMTPGMRAVTFRSNDVAGVAGFVLPGDRVDVLLTRTGEGQQSTVTQVLVDNIKVLAVDQIDDDATDKPVVARAITIEVTPEQAQTMRLAEAVGTVSLALRQVGDEVPSVKRVTTMRDLGSFYVAPTRASYTPPPAGAAASVAPRPSGPQVRVTRGVETKSYTVTR